MRLIEAVPGYTGMAVGGKSGSQSGGLLRSIPATAGPSRRLSPQAPPLRITFPGVRSRPCPPPRSLPQHRSNRRACVERRITCQYRAASLLVHRPAHFLPPVHSFIRPSGEQAFA